MYYFWTSSTEAVTNDNYGYHVGESYEGPSSTIPAQQY
jgi:hypothetical protein